MVFYFIAGRDWATISAKKRWMRDYLDKAQVALGPYFERNADAERRFRARFAGTYVERLSDTMSREDGLGVVTADSAEIFPTGAEKLCRVEDSSRAGRRCQDDSPSCAREVWRPGPHSTGPPHDQSPCRLRHEHHIGG